MVKRFKKTNKKNPTLDLHGIKHGDAYVLVEDFVLENQTTTPLTIITGNSNQMKKIVIDALNKHGFMYSDGDYYNRGYINVLN